MTPMKEIKEKWDKMSILELRKESGQMAFILYLNLSNYTEETLKEIRIVKEEIDKEIEHREKAKP